MRKFYYKAINLKANKIKGRCECDSSNKLRQILREKEYYILSFREIKNYRAKKKFTLKENAMFCKKLYDLLSSGISLINALNIMGSQSEDDFSKAVFLQLVEDVSKGKSLNGSIKNSNNIFPNFTVFLTKIGEDSGNLEKIFNMLYKHYYSRYMLKNKIEKALIYPSITVLLFFITVIFMRIKVLPVFLSMIKELGGDIPISTKIFLWSIDNIWIVIVFFLIVIFTSIIKNKSFLQSIKFKMPYIKKYLIMWEQIKFIESLNVLITSGVSIIDAITLILESTSNIYIKDKYKMVLEEINKGENLFKALEATELFSKQVVSMFYIAETSGKMDSCTENLVKILNDDFTLKLDKLVKMIEPFTILIISIFIGFMLLGVLMPIMNITSSLSV
ncbi:type II secretion system F family protein [Haloimpatiens sp. FM7315]|uniref:type II secretion system F family protein n=1 Tax=Haloimpatiens sp. FM7315 TaxID=3298609 RepID=UPI00370C8321